MHRRQLGQVVRTSIDDVEIDSNDQVLRVRAAYGCDRFVGAHDRETDTEIVVWAEIERSTGMCDLMPRDATVELRLQHAVDGRAIVVEQPGTSSDATTGGRQPVCVHEAGAAWCGAATEDYGGNRVQIPDPMLSARDRIQVSSGHGTSTFTAASSTGLTFDVTVPVAVADVVQLERRSVYDGGTRWGFVLIDNVSGRRDGRVDGTISRPDGAVVTLVDEPKLDGDVATMTVDGWTVETVMWTNPPDTSLRDAFVAGLQVMPSGPGLAPLVASADPVLRSGDVELVWILNGGEALSFWPDPTVDCTANLGTDPPRCLPGVGVLYVNRLYAQDDELLAWMHLRDVRCSSACSAVEGNALRDAVTIVGR